MVKNKESESKSQNSGELSRSYPNQPWVEMGRKPFPNGPIILGFHIGRKHLTGRNKVRTSQLADNL